MRVPVNVDSPVPLYHQIAEGIRYRIATGALPADTQLPTLREAAKLWGVNLHTVRHAYKELADQGFVATRGPAGTRVLPIPPPSPGGGASDPAAIRQFVEQVVHDGQAKLGISVPEIISALGDVDTSVPSTAPAVTITECTQSQSEDLALQFREIWDVEAQPWCFTDGGDLPPGPIVGTYFHYNELRSRWRDRRADLRFVVIAPNADVAQRVRAEQGSEGCTMLHLCELDDDMAHNMAADLAVQLPRDDYEVKPLVVETPSAAFDALEAPAPIVFSPRTWGLLSETERRHPRSYKLDYVIDREDAERIGREFHWRSK